MESYGIPILEKYSLMLKTLPYYSYTHKAWILLSCFSQKSRKILKDNYKAFLYWMEKNLLQVEIDHRYYNIKRKFSLPWDLFKFNITIRREEHATFFKEWIANINLIFLKRVSKLIIINKIFFILTLFSKLYLVMLNHSAYQQCYARNIIKIIIQI